MDSDSIYTTITPSIVSSAKKFYKQYPTIVNNIPKDKTHYSYTMRDYAEIDNKLHQAQQSIGESSNLAQIALTYTYNFDDEKFEDYVCILSVIAQLAIDSAKRAFDINIPEEIKWIKQNMEIDANGYPAFWLGIRKDFNEKKVNRELVCPMNCLYSYKPEIIRRKNDTLSFENYLIDKEVEPLGRTSKKVEQLIEKYSFDFLLDRTMGNSDDEDIDIIFQDRFYDLVADIRALSLPNKYQDLVLWLVKRAFKINNIKNYSKMVKNRALLLKALYEVNPVTFMKCFKTEEELLRKIQKD